jgi:hypothetical protein
MVELDPSCRPFALPQLVIEMFQLLLTLFRGWGGVSIEIAYLSLSLIDVILEPSSVVLDFIGLRIVIRNNLEGTFNVCIPARHYMAQLLGAITAELP